MHSSPTYSPSAAHSMNGSLVTPMLLTRSDVTSQVGYLLFLLVNATVFLRPGEMVPALLGLPIYEASILGCLALSLNGVRDRLSPEGLRQQPITLCVLGIFAACILSHATHAYLSGMVEAADLFFKVSLYYVLLVTVIDTPQRFRWLLITTIICSTIMISLCVIDYIEWVDFTFVEHITDRDGEGEDGEVILVWRMRGTGIFEDPNDISLLIVGTGVLCTYFLTDRNQGPLRALWLLPIGLMVFALLCTRSRGGLLSAIAAALTYIMLRYGRAWSVVIGAAGMVALPLLAGRQGEIDLEDGTGQDRIQLWSEGLAELKSPSLFFGVGQGMYADIAGLVAHNSFVHAFVELGLFGGTWFFGCFLLSALGLYRVTHPSVRMRDPELHRCARYLAALLGGWSIGLFSLSRCYVVPTYMVVGLMAAYINLAGIQMWPTRVLTPWNAWHRKWLAIGSICCLAFLYLFVRVFAHFG